MLLRTVGLGLLALASVVAVAVVAMDSSYAQRNPHSNFEAAKEKYQEDLSRPALLIRTRNAERMADFGEEEGLRLLFQRYQRPEREGPEDHIQYTTATIASSYYDVDEHKEIFEDWLEAETDPRDAWLWFVVQFNRVQNEMADEVMEYAKNNRNPAYLRAVSMEALARGSRVGLLGEIPAMITDRRSARPGSFDQSLLVEAAGGAIYQMRGQLSTDVYYEAAQSLIAFFDEEPRRRRLAERSQLVLRRMMKAAWNTNRLYDTADGWRRALDRARQGGESDGATVAAPTFVGIRADGNRFAYVIDMSDSMLEPLTTEEREDIEGIVSTGDGRRGGNRRGGEEEEEDDIDWSNVTNRFDAAREFLKMSLQTLGEDRYFTITIIGKTAEVFHATNGMLQATERNVSYVSRELDAIEPGPRENLRPHGVLKGATDLHGGLMLAFQMRSRGKIDTDEHVAEVVFNEGVDAVFVLSDGAPSWDSFEALHMREPEDNVGDPESGTRGQNTDQVYYPGPYRSPVHKINHLINDIVRMNLLRRAQINCIGTGEADMDLLRAIASIGMGEAKSVSELGSGAE